LRAETDKANDLGERPTFAFTFKSVVLFTDPKTRVDTSAPVLIAAESTVSEGAHSADRNYRLKKGAKTALRALREALDTFGNAPSNTDPFPPGVRIVSIDKWREVAYRLGISRSSNGRARQQAFKRAVDKLLSRGLVVRLGDVVWIVSRGEHGGEHTNTP
jgi:hypothetical protein